MEKNLSSKSKSGAKAKKKDSGFSLISDEKLVALYAAMVKCRMLEQRARTLFQQGRLENDLHGSVSREASAAAIAIDLEPADTICIPPTDWLPAFLKGLSLETLFRTLAPSTVPHKGLEPFAVAEAEQKNILLTTDGSEHLELILQRAIAIQTDKSKAVVASFIPPGPDALKEWRKVMTSAATRKLQIVFVNHLPCDVVDPLSPSASKAGIPETLSNGVPAIGVDASDPVALYRVAYEAILRARQGRGATLLQCCTSQRGTTGTDPDTQSDDPVSSMEVYLKHKGIQLDHVNNQLIPGFHRDLDVATRFLES